MPFHHGFHDLDHKPRLFCVSYAQPTVDKVIEEEKEEIYSSLKKARGESFTDSLHVTRIPLGSPRPSDVNVKPDDPKPSTMIHVSGDSAHPSTHRPVDATPAATAAEKITANKLEPTTSSDDVRRQSRQPSGNFEGWAGRLMEGRVLEAPNPNRIGGGNFVSRSTNVVRGFWETNIARDQRAREDEARHRKPHTYEFPKWRSTDALSASLVASNAVCIPADSRIPEHRLRRMQQTERDAVQVKREIHETADEPRRLHKGKSLDSLNMQVDYTPWYDTEKIKQAVSRESIANIGLAREFFENVANRDWRSANTSQRDSMCSVNLAGVTTSTTTSMAFQPPPPPLPPKSDVVQMRQLQNASGIADTHRMFIQQTPQLPTVLDSPPSSHNSQRFEMPHNRLSQQESPQSAVDPIEQQEVLLMLYMKQNMDIIAGLGINIPSEILHEMDELQGLPVELRVIEEDPVFSPATRNGRYLRKGQVPMQQQQQRLINNPIGKFKKNNAADFRQQNGGHVVGELRSVRERDDELRRSRRVSELSSSFELPNGHGDYNDFHNGHHQENFGYGTPIHDYR